MAQPKTQDTQKVFQSSTQKLQSFMGAVENPSSSKNMETIYSNMEKLFDAFTQGALMGQGANSEILLRTVYRSLSDDFLKIVQDTDAVQKIMDVIKDKQESIAPEEVDKALVSETTKKVITKTLDPNDLDPMSVVLDFTDELQTAILQVKLNLTREYEKRMLERAKSYEGQQEDLDRLHGEVFQQNQQFAEILGGMSAEDSTWKVGQSEKLDDMYKLFSNVANDAPTEKSYLQSITDHINKDGGLQEMAKPPKRKFDPAGLIKDIQGLQRVKEKEAEKLQKAGEKPKQEKKPVAEKPKQAQKPIQPQQIGEKIVGPEEKKAEAKPAKKDTKGDTKEQAEQVKSSKEQAVAPAKTLKEEKVVKKAQKLGQSKIVQKKLGGILKKESKGKIPLMAFGPEDAKYFKDTKSSQDMERTMQKLVLKKVMEGKIKTPIPAPLVRPMIKVDEWFNKQTEKAERISQKIVPRRMRGSRSPINSGFGNRLQKKADETEKSKISLKEVEAMDKPDRNVQSPKPPKPIFKKPKTIFEKPRKEKPVKEKPIKEKPIKEKGTKLDVGNKPTGYFCTCPVCGNKHLKGMPHSHKGVGGGGEAQTGNAQGKNTRLARGGGAALAQMGGAMPVGFAKVGQAGTGGRAGPLPTKEPPKKSPMKFGFLPVRKKEGEGDEGQKSDSKKQPTLTKEGVENNISRVHENISKTLANPKFKNNFMLKYQPLQKGITKQMGSMEKQETKISKDLNKTENNIKANKKKKGAGFLSKFLFGGLTGFMFTVIGGLILIALARVALSKWKKTYMPKTDGKTSTIFGIPIPGLSTMKALAIGMRNFIVIGLPNWIDRLKLFFGKIWKSLFGNKGAFKDQTQTQHTLRRIIGALIIGMTKKAVGTAVKWLIIGLGTVLNIFLPGAGSALIFLAKFVPAILTFITTQIMLLWSKRKAAKEEQFKATMAGQQATGKKMVKQIYSQLHALGKGVKPIKGQMALIPGLETPKAEGAGGPKRSAIMRRVPMKMNKNFKTNQKAQEQAVEQEMKDNEKQDKKRVESGGGLIGSMTSSIAAIQADVESGKFFEKMKNNKELIARAKKNRSWWDTYMCGSVTSTRIQMVREHILDTSVRPEMAKLDSYIAGLSKSKRFQNVKGPLYDPVAGWNPGYRVYAVDLRSAIPLTPFEAIHAKPDINIGEPADEEADSKGWMPFTWVQNGIKHAVHPVNYEIARAKAIRKLYEWVGKQAVTFDFWGNPTTDMENFKKQVLEKGFKVWREWNRASAKHSKFEYEHPEKVLYKNKFVEFLNKFDKGEIDEKNNTLEYAKTLDKTWWERNRKWVAAGLLMSTGAGLMAAAAVAGLAATVAAVAIPLAVVAAPFVGVAVGVKKATKLIRGATKYNKNKPKGFFGRIGRAVGSSIRLMSWRGEKAHGLEYGQVRDFMIDGGVISMFQSGQIVNPIGKAIPLIERLTDMGRFSKAKDKDTTAMNNLMTAFFRDAGIKGYSWKKVKDDKVVQAAFAQSFMEYLALRVLPQWNIVEQLLSNAMTHPNKKTKGAMYKGMAQLHYLLLGTSITSFLKDHLRFPNMKVTVIDYSNAGTRIRGLFRRAALDSYRKKMGIPTRSEKDSILKGMKKIWKQIPDMKDTELTAIAKKVGKTLAAAEFEAKHTGDLTFVNEVRKFSAYVMDTIKGRNDAAASAANSKVVKSPGDVKNAVQPVPPKDMQQIEEERRKKDAEEKAKAEEAKRKKEEEDRKRLAEEAKRKEELVAAQAKIKAMEAIREQEQKYESVLEKLVSDPGKVTDKELADLKEDASKVKQEAENRIAQLPREERELKLALIRGDKISDKTFKEVKDTAVGLHGSLQAYMDEVNKIPVGSVLALENQPGGTGQQQIKMQDSDAVDMGDE